MAIPELGDHQYLRLLDIDDLILITLLYKGSSCSDIARALGLTPPAISHRLNKISEEEPDLIARSKGKVVISSQGQDRALQYVIALEVLVSQ